VLDDSYVCPSCGSRLANANAIRGRVLACTNCGGKHIGAGLLRRYAQPAILNKIWELARAGRGKPGRPCPTCGMTMIEVPVLLVGHPLALDVCASCYCVWFDPRELEAVPPFRYEPRRIPQKVKEALAMLEVERLGKLAAKAEDDDIPEPWAVLPAFFQLPVEVDPDELERKPWATWLFLFGIFLAAIFSFPQASKAVALFGFVPGEPFRFGGLSFLSYFFLHANLFHLLGNMYFLWLFGSRVEDSVGKVRFVVALLAGAVLAAIIHAVGDPRSSIPLIGASGGISTAIVFYCLQFPRERLGVLVVTKWVTFPAIVGLVFWFALQAWIAYGQLKGFGHVSALAHLGGGLAGLFFGLLWRDKSF